MSVIVATDPMFPWNLVSTLSIIVSTSPFGSLGNPYPKSTLAVSTASAPPDVAIVPTIF